MISSASVLINQSSLFKTLNWNYEKLTENSNSNEYRAGYVQYVSKVEFCLLGLAPSQNIVSRKSYSRKFGNMTVTLLVGDMAKQQVKVVLLFQILHLGYVAKGEEGVRI